VTAAGPTTAEDRRVPSGTLRVTVAVPTFRRPADLRAGLPMLLAHAREVTGSGRYAAEVLVVDNDPERSAEAVVREFAAADLRYAAEPVPGIAAVRNRALDEAAGARLLAFIDDDERPLEGWLARLLETWEASGAAAVSGRILADYAGELDPWIRAGEFFVRRSMPTGTPIDVAAAGNLLLDLEQIRALGIRFESPLGMGAGEDTVFSRALVLAGGRMVWCNESAAVDFVPFERMTRRWVLTRAWSHGNATVLVDLWLTERRLARLAIRLRGIGGGALRIAAGVARWGMGLAVRSPRHRARGLRGVLRGAGMVVGACGLVFEEYARTGRRWKRSRSRAR
jgi:glycosyltransferase involved in cell wall biosynthesis